MFPWGSSETRYFFELTPERILESVEAYGYRCTGRTLALNSMENRVYEVEIEADTTSRTDPRNYRIIKFYRPGRWSKEQIQDEHDFLLNLAGEEIPVVAPERTPSGETLMQVKGLDLWCVLFPKVGGRLPEELNEADLRQVGRLLGRMHNVGASRKAEHRITLSCKSFGRDNLEFLLQEDRVPEMIRPTFANLVKELCDLGEPLFAGLKTQRIHGDCHLGNLIWGKDGLFFVDLDDMMTGPAVQDMWLLFPSRGEGAAELWEALLQGYEQMRAFDRRELRLVELLRALRYVHFAAWIAKRWQDPAFPRSFPEFGTDKYWQILVQDLREQLELVRTASWHSQNYTY